MATLYSTTAPNGIIGPLNDSPLLSRWFFEDGFPMRPSFATPLCLQPQQSPLQFLPRLLHIRWLSPAKLSCQVDEASTGLLQKSDDVQPLRQKEYWTFCLVLRILFQMGFSRLPGGLGHFADSNSIPWNPPTIFIQSWLQQYCWCSCLYSADSALSATPFCLRSMRCRSFDDSMKNLPKICQIPMYCQSK